MPLLRPTRDYVLVEIEAEPAMSSGGIALLIPAEEPRQSVGRVLAVGPGERDKKGRRNPLSVQIGDRVAFSRYGHSTPPGEPNQRMFREPSVHYVCDQ